ncbi:AT-hook motif nuclear-localized protein 11 [Sesamum alatum]|uniref:AT-hook motif nuclear-localized protein n=1 Tax=Sesamum alatum TaxID=300844 RepID=A0AAE1Z1M1_9LAMI|nr:AT-hook motif nuclear-localized protein 11 [Sesamum alatum]
MEVENAVSQYAAAATTKPEILEVSEDEVEVAVATDEEKLENEGRGDEQAGVAVRVARGGEVVFVPKRNRERPKKQQAWEARGQQFMAVPAYSPTSEKRGRGRPRGSSKWQNLNIVQRIWSFSQMIPDSICILSASGTISSAEIFVPASYGDGQFTIIYLNGSHTYDEKRGGKICLLSVQLANVDGRSYSGAVASSLIAAGPTLHTIDAKGKGTLVIDPPVVPNPPVIDPEVAMKGPDCVSCAAPQPSSAHAATPEAEGVGGDE